MMEDSPLYTGEDIVTRRALPMIREHAARDERYIDDYRRQLQRLYMP